MGIVANRLRGTRFRYAMLGVLLAMILGFGILHTPLWHAYWFSIYTPSALLRELPDIVSTLVLCTAFAVPLAALYRLITALLVAGPRGWLAWARSRPKTATAFASAALLAVLAYGGWSYWDANCTWQETASFVAYPNEPGYHHSADRIAVSRAGDWIAVSGIRYPLRDVRKVDYGQIAISHRRQGSQALPEVLQKNEGGQERSVSFSPDEDLLMVADGTDTLQLIDPAAADVAREITLESAVLEATWLNDGKFYTRAQTLFDTIAVRDLADTSLPPQVWPGIAPPPYGPYQFTDADARFLMQTDREQIVVSRLSDQRPVMTIPFQGYGAPPIFSGDGRLMIMGQTFCDLEAGTQTTLPRMVHRNKEFASRERVVSQGIFPEGPLLLLDHFSKWLIHVRLVHKAAMVVFRSRIVLFDPRTGQTLAQTRLFREPIYCLGVSHDGRVMAAVIGERIYVWDVPE